MDLTLKRAAAVAQAALETANAIKVNGTLAISIHDLRPVDAQVVAAKEALQVTLNDLGDLLSAHGQLRSQIGAVNATAGISALLTERAAIERLEKRLAQVLDQTEEDDYSGTTVETDLTVVSAKLGSYRSQSALSSHYRVPESVSVNLIDNVLRTSIGNDLVSLRRQKADLADQLANLNLTTKVTLDAATVATLQKHGLV